MNTHVRDTFISQQAFEAVPNDRQQKIQALVTEFNGLGYISAWDIGPDQAARMSKREIERQQNTRLRVFRIEEKIQQLLKTDAELEKENLQQQAKEKEENRLRIVRRIEQLEMYCKRKLESKRKNSVKNEYQELQTELANFQ